MKLWIQGNSPEESSLVRVMFYYEASEYVKDNMFYRTLCYDGILQVLPALELESTVYWENSQEGGVVSIGIKNKSNAMLPAFSISGLFCDSRTWFMEPVGDSTIPALPVQQELKLCFKVRNRHVADNAEDSKQCSQQHLQFEAEKMTSTTFDTTVKSIKVHKVCTDAANNSSKQSKFLTVALEWCLSKDERSCGQHYLSLQDISNEQYDLSNIGLNTKSNTALQDNSQSLAALHQLVKWKVLHETTVENDFAKSRLFVVPITVIVQNLYDCEVRVKLDGLDSGQNQVTNSPQFLWTSKSLSKFLLAPHDTRTISLNACFVTSGVYNLNSFSVWAVPTLIEDKTPLLPQNCQYSCLLTVNDNKGPS